MLDERGDDLTRRTKVGQRIGDHESLEAGEAVKWDGGDLMLFEVLDVYASLVGERDCRRAVYCRVADREIDLMARGHATFEGNAIGLGDRVSVGVFTEVQSLCLA